MEVIEEEKMSWMLFADKDEYFLSVVCGSVGIFTIDVALSKMEIAQYIEGSEGIGEMAAKIRACPDTFGTRNIKKFNASEKVGSAVKEWRRIKAAKASS